MATDWAAIARKINVDSDADPKVRRSLAAIREGFRQVEVGFNTGIEGAMGTGAIDLSVSDAISGALAQSWMGL